MVLCEAGLDARGHRDAIVLGQSEHGSFSLLGRGDGRSPGNPLPSLGFRSAPKEDYVNQSKLLSFPTAILPRPALRVNMQATAPHDEDSISVNTPDGRTLTGHPETVRQMLASIERDQERRKHWPQTAGGDTHRAMTALAQSFPTLC